MKTKEKLLTSDEVAKALHVQPGTVLAWAAVGRVAANPFLPRPDIRAVAIAEGLQRPRHQRAPPKA